MDEIERQDPHRPKVQIRVSPKAQATPQNGRWLRPGQVAQLYDVNPATVRRWEQLGKIHALKTPLGYRLFDRQSIQAMLDQDPLDETHPNKKTKTNFLYCRVSSHHQAPDLARQRTFLQSRYPDYQLVSDIGSGINFKRKGLQTILDAAIDGNLQTLVVSHKDRLCRFGFELIEHIINRSGGKIIILDHQDDKPGSSNEELAEDLLSIVAVFNARQMGARRYSKHQNILEVSQR